MKLMKRFKVIGKKMIGEAMRNTERGSRRIALTSISRPPGE